MARAHAAPPSPRPRVSRTRPRRFRQRRRRVSQERRRDSRRRSGERPGSPTHGASALSARICCTVCIIRFIGGRLRCCRSARKHSRDRPRGHERVLRRRVRVRAASAALVRRAPGAQHRPRVTGGPHPRGGGGCRRCCRRSSSSHSHSRSRSTARFLVVRIPELVQVIIIVIIITLIVSAVASAARCAGPSPACSGTPSCLAPPDLGPTASTARRRGAGLAVRVVVRRGRSDRCRCGCRQHGRRGSSGRGSHRS